MKRLQKYMLGAALGLFLLLPVGCASSSLSPSKFIERFFKKERSVKQETAEVEKKEVQKAAAFVYGSGKFLDAETNTTPAIEGARMLNERARFTLGEPSYADALTIDAIVTGYLSQAEDDRKKSLKLLAGLDASVKSLQSKLEKLEAEKQKLDNNKDDATRKVVASADGWLGAKSKRLLMWGSIFAVIAFLTPIALKVVGIITGVGAFGAPLDLVVGSTAKTLFRFAPKATERIGLIAKERYDEVHSTTDDLVRVIQDVKHKDPEAFTKVLKSRLERVTDDTTRDVIRKFKTSLPR
jgi:hypothetical protein